MEISASMLACDFSNLETKIIKLKNSGIYAFHFDIMDGLFVENFSFGANFVKFARKYVDSIFEVHLMISNPLKYIKSFADAGADIITFHLENADSKICYKKCLDCINLIKNLNKKVGIAVNPSTTIEKIFPIINLADLLLIMTVNPGFGGQKFMNNQIEKLDILKNNKKNKDILLEVDGGINIETAKIVKSHGADICVSGSYLFTEKNYKLAIKNLKNP
ncbi:MAG: ribulose-phosphate 3-epimerase [Candidatus Improbicoccus devescovinae]|nr:MAG: ribulose-phosphate 3-epimerase [Candidatus Improbicoccus devescovinae]